MSKTIKVFKFGGGSVQDAAGVRQLKDIILKQGDAPLVVVISAFGKTTNLIEKMVAAYRSGNETELSSLFQILEENHTTIAQELLPDDERILDDVCKVLVSLKDQFCLEPSIDYDYDYDRIVSYGEIISTTLISSYLNIIGVKNKWLDARDLIRTDDSHREAHVNWKITTPIIQNSIDEYMCEDKVSLFITQGFIGATFNGDAVTLGREGSDYTAAIFGYALQASEVVIWKDVPGLFNADPKIYPDAVKLDEIPYEEAIELSYYGASIIHPKTLKPLQNKQIPLYVKPFFNPGEPGTLISSSMLTNPVSSFIFKKDQILISIFPKDFSFIAVQNLSEIFNILSQHRLKINLMQNSALSFSICVDNIKERIETAVKELKMKYKVKYNDKVELATIRHYTEDSLIPVLRNKEILVEQKNRTTIQLVLKEVR